MNYQTTATPITTEAEFDAAKRAGARIEYTACGPGGVGLAKDHYDMPRAFTGGSGGWINPILHHFRVSAPGQLYRAFYPVTSNEEPEA